jgi:hypothetical protein
MILESRRNRIAYIINKKTDKLIGEVKYENTRHLIRILDHFIILIEIKRTRQILKVIRIDNDMLIPILLKTNMKQIKEIIKINKDKFCLLHEDLHISIISYK